MPPGDLGVGGIAPLDLGKAGNRAAEVWQVKGTGGVVVGEVTDRLASGRRLDYGERGIRELADVRPAPRGRGCVGRGYDQNGQNQETEPLAHLISLHLRAPHGIGCRIDGLAPL